MGKFPSVKMKKLIKQGRAVIDIRPSLNGERIANCRLVDTCSEANCRTRSPKLLNPTPDTSWRRMFASGKRRRALASRKPHSIRCQVPEAQCWRKNSSREEDSDIGAQCSRPSDVAGQVRIRRHAACSLGHECVACGTIWGRVEPSEGDEVATPNKAVLCF